MNSEYIESIRDSPVYGRPCLFLKFLFSDFNFKMGHLGKHFPLQRKVTSAHGSVETKSTFVCGDSSNLSWTKTASERASDPQMVRLLLGPLSNISSRQMPDVHRRAQLHSQALRHVFVPLKQGNIAKYLPDLKHNSAASTQRLLSKKKKKTHSVCACTCVSAPAVCNSWLLLPQLTQITNGEVWMNSSRAEKRKFYCALSP